MKRIMSAFIILLLGSGCSGLSSSKTKFNNDGVTSVLNGRNEIDSLEYSCDSCYEILQDRAVLDTIISVATSEAKARLRNKLSFRPLSLRMYVAREDSLYYVSGNKIDSLVSVVAEYKCIGKNGYGVENEVESTSIIYLVNNKIVDLIGKIRRPPLAFREKGVVSRKLSLFDDDGELIIQPVDLNGSIHLIVTTDETCVEDARLTISTKDDNEITLKSWNKFNCDNTSYFRLTKSQLEILNSSTIKYISFSEDKLIFCAVPENDQDYFIQYTRLLKD